MDATVRSSVAGRGRVGLVVPSVDATVRSVQSPKLGSMLEKSPAGGSSSLGHIIERNLQILSTNTKRHLQSFSIGGKYLDIERREKAIGANVSATE